MIKNTVAIKKTVLAMRRYFLYFCSSALIPIWIFCIAPVILKIPNTFSYQAGITSIENFYDPISSNFAGEQYSKAEYSYEVVAQKANTLTIQNIFHVESLGGETIFKAEPLYNIDPITRKHAPENTGISREGYLFAPRWLTKNTTFTFWHPTYQQPAHMQFVGEEKVYGLRVFKFQKSNTEPVDQTGLMDFLPGVPETRGIKLASNVYMWVEPISGYLVKLEDFSTDYFYFDIHTGERLTPYNQFLNSYTETSVQEHVALAKAERNKVVAIQLGVPIILLFGILAKLLKSKRITKILSMLAENKTAISVLILGMIATFIAAFIVNQIIYKDLQDHFITQTNEAVDLIKKRMDIYISILQGGKGLFDADQETTRDEWHIYTNSLDLPKNYPGIQVFGVAKVVYPEEKEATIDSIRQSGFPNFQLFPEGNRDKYTPIVYIEPFDEKNQKAFGYDMFSDGVRRQAMIKAEQSGLPTASGKIELIQEDAQSKQAGFLIYTPIYEQGSPDKIWGYVYGAFRMDDLMKGVFGKNTYDINFHIYDGLKKIPEQKTFDFNHSATNEDKENTQDPVYYKVDTIYIANHPWTLEFTNIQNYTLTSVEKILPVTVLVLGTIITLLMTSIIFTISKAKQGATDYADTLTANLKTTVTNLEQTKKALLNVLEDVEQEKSNFAQVSSRLALATKAAKIGVWQWDVIKNIITWDDQMYKLYGIKKEDFGGEYEAWQKGVHPDDKEKSNEAIQLALKGIKPFTVMFRVLWPNKEVHYIQAHAVVERDAQGNPLQMVGVNWDITKETIVDKEKTEFVSLASHQLRTPITAIQWNLEMLLSGDYGSVIKKQKDVLQETYGMSTRMSDLISTLLNISRIEMGVFVIEPTPVDFMSVCEEVLLEIKPQFALKKQKVIKKFAAELPKIAADQRLLHIIFQNFISNASKYTPDKGTITITLKKEESHVVFKVTNSGEPIPTKDQSSIFTKLFRASNAQEQDPNGNGLGLYITKEIVENAGGKIWFTSEKGKDTVFACSFPLSGMKAKKGTKTLA